MTQYIPLWIITLRGQGTAPSKTEITKTVLQQDGTNKVHIKVNSDADPFSVKARI